MMMMMMMVILSESNEIQIQIDVNVYDGSMQNFIDQNILRSMMNSECTYLGV